MDRLHAICQWIEDGALGKYISSSTWAFPTIESIHVFFLVIVVGTIAIVDLRLLGVASRNRSVSQLSNDVLPITWGAFVMALITGSLLFTSRATHYLADVQFCIKIVLLMLAGANMLVFHVLTYRHVHRWDDDPVTPVAARVAGALSLIFWIGVVFFGRWIGFTVV